MMKKEISQMKYALLIYAILLIGVAGLLLTSGCTTTMTVMAECKKICRGPVQHYQDDTIECMCKQGEEIKK